MKRFIPLILAALLLLTSCAKVGPEPTPTETPTEAPTAAPTAVPTAVPTDAPVPAETPDFTGLIPQLGRLTDGPIFPEPFKYLVLSGESNMHYVFDNMGELLYTFPAESFEHRVYRSGLFTEDGISCWIRLSDRSEVTPFELFDGMAISVNYVWEEDGDYFDGRYELTLIRDTALENPVEFAPGEISFGNLGGIARFGDGYLVFNRSYEYFGDRTASTVTRLDKDFREVSSGRLNDIEGLTGVYGGKYLIVQRRAEAGEDGYQYYDIVYDICDSDGNIKMSNVRLDNYLTEWYCLDDELYGLGVMSAQYLQDADGNWYDKDLKRTDTVPEYPDYDEWTPGDNYYWPVDRIKGYFVEYSGPFVGIKDDDGNWLFRIYNPAYVSDYNNEGWPYWLDDRDYHWD